MFVKTGLDANIHKHIAHSACFDFLCDYDYYNNRLWSSLGPKFVIEMLVELTKLYDEFIANTKNTGSTRI